MQEQTTIYSFPVELILCILSILPLQELNAARNVCRSWRCLVSEASSLPVRGKLFKLWLRYISHRQSASASAELREPGYRHSVDSASSGRMGLIETATKEGLELPEEFVLWSAEWPDIGQIVKL
ncbi:hypothetical protein HYDPIDRAFT_109506 [Hydnomerulius pinastri MD-312]|nr:hypothetical protein HYDPIDRAFT_109506 [Hydnomerulius pinastri MD-312]